jgi:hypothetical protein
MGKLPPKKPLTNLERDFRLHLEERGSANNTVRGYVADAEQLQRLFKLEDWGALHSL